MENSRRKENIRNALWRACDTFNKKVITDNSKDIILTVLFLKYISDMWRNYYEICKDEYGNEPEKIEETIKNELFHLPEHASFYYIWKHRHEPNIDEKITQAMQAIEEENKFILRDVKNIAFQCIPFNTEWLVREKNKKLFFRELLETFANVNLSNDLTYKEKLNVIGNAYEYVIKNFFTKNGNKTSGFYTPAEVSNLMAALLEPKPGDTICDPACGSGSLLITCARNIEDNHGNRDCALYGQEVFASSWFLAKMNMSLHGKENYTIEWGDTIRNPKLLDGHGELILFDMVVANLPLSLDKWGYEDAREDKFSRFLRGVPPKTKGDYAFILHMVETLKPKTGRMAVIVPHGVLFRGSSEGEIRKQLIEENLLDAVIGLPEKLFYGTGKPAAIMIFKKQKVDDKVLFIDASREFKSGKNQNQLTEDNIEKIISTYHNRKSIGKYSYLASREKVIENDYNINIPQYVNTFEKEKIDMITARAERENLKAKIKQLEEKANEYLGELDY